MKYLLATVFLLLILSFCGCAVKEAAAMEYVSDYPESVVQPAFYLTAEVPQGAILTVSSDDGKFAVFTNTDYDIIEEIFVANSADEALEHVTGQSAEQLSPLKISSFPQTEYRYAWTAAGESGTLACSGTLLCDGTYYYSVSVQCAAEKEKEYREVFSELLSSVSLQEV